MNVEDIRLEWTTRLGKFADINIQAYYNRRRIANLALATFHAQAHCYYVAWIWVTRKYRRKGIALALYCFVYEFMGIRLLGGDTNDASEALYRKFLRVTGQDDSGRKEKPPKANSGTFAELAEAIMNG